MEKGINVAVITQVDGNGDRSLVILPENSKTRNWDSVSTEEKITCIAIRQELIGKVKIKIGRRIYSLKGEDNE